MINLFGKSILYARCSLADLLRVSGCQGNEMTEPRQIIFRRVEFRVSGSREAVLPEKETTTMTTTTTTTTNLVPSLGR